MTTTTTTTTTPPPGADGWLQELQQTISAACLYAPIFTVIEGFVEGIVQSHFANAPRLKSPRLRKLIWSPEPATCILIELADSWAPETTGHRPAILIKRNALNSVKLAIGNQHQGRLVDRSGDPHFSKLWVGSLTVFCLSEHPTEADLIAGEVQEQLDCFAPLILRSSMQLKKYEVVEIGTRTFLEEAHQRHVVPITLGYAYEQTWALRQHRPLLKGIFTRFGCAD